MHAALLMCASHCTYTHTLQFIHACACCVPTHTTGAILTVGRETRCSECEIVYIEAAGEYINVLVLSVELSCGGTTHLQAQFSSAPLRIKEITDKLNQLDTPSVTRRQV